MTTFINESKIFYLQAANGEIIQEQNGDYILVNISYDTDIWTNSSKNSASFSNESRNTTSWVNTNKS